MTNPFLTTIFESAWLGLAVGGMLMALLPWVRRDGLFRTIFAGLTIVLTVRYAWWRFTETIPSISQPLDFTVGVVFFGLELGAVLGSILGVMTLMRTRNRSVEVEAHKGWLFSQPKPPRVSVFICTYNEEEEILERTIVGAMSMDYANYEVWVLDDGRRDWLKQLSEKLGCNYLTRPDNSHAKAGNINHALKYLADNDREPDFISILDADFVPNRNFLWRTVTLFHENDVGIVQTPQHFSNPDPIQANLAAADSWPDEQRFFFDVVMPARDAWGTAFCCGTSSVIRYEGLMKIGGFPTDSVTEDYLVTLRMQRQGYRTVYLNEKLSLGLAPEGLKEYVTQRSRWCLGFIQIFRSQDGPLALGNGLRLIDRGALLESFFYWFASYLFRVACILVPVLYLMFDVHAVDVGIEESISHFLPAFIAQITLMAWLSEGRVLPVMFDVTQLLAAREIITAAVVGLVKPHGHKFKVTAKGGDRSKAVVQWRMVSMFLLLLGLTVAGVLWAFLFDPNRDLQQSSSISLYWSWYNILVLLIAIFVSVERPRLRKNERFPTHETYRMFANGAGHEFTALDISIDGVRFRGKAPGEVGDEVALVIRDVRVVANIVRAGENEFAIAVKATPMAHIAMIQYVYSGRFETGVKSVDPRALASRVLARVWE